MSSFNKTVKRVASSVAVLSAAAACTLSRSETRADSKQPKIHVFESDANGFNTKTVFYDNGSEVVAIDLQFTSELAEQAIAFLRERSENPLTYAIVTHPNPDKFNGIPVFQKHGAQVVASKATVDAMAGVHAYKKYYFVNTAKMFTDETYPALGSVDRSFEKDLDLRLNNGEEIILSELQGPGVSSNQTVVYVPAANALAVGDLVHHKAHAWLEGGIVGGKATPTLASWIAGLKELLAAYAERNPMVYGGRGEAVALDAAVREQIAYLQRADQIVSDYVAALGTKKSELAGDKAGEHFAELQSRFEVAFPSYTLAYMIQYGVYGLAMAK